MIPKFLCDDNCVGDHLQEPLLKFILGFLIGAGAGSGIGSGIGFFCGETFFFGFITDKNSSNLSF
jgi:hypothetical protein